MKRCTIIFFTLICSFLFANDFRFYTDFASFYDNDKAFVELYFMLPRYEMQYREMSKGNFEATYIVAVNVTQNAKKVFSTSFTVEDHYSKGDTIRSNDYIPEIQTLHLLPGTYKFNTMVKDMNSGKLSERETILLIPTYEPEILSLSDIQIASYVGQTDKINKFTKLNAYDLIPQANPEFDKYIGGFYTYFEVYNLKAGVPYQIQSSIRDLNNKIIQKNKPIEQESLGMFDPIIDYVDIKDLPSGIYDYHIKITDKKSGQFIENKKHIYMIRETEMDLYMYDEYVEYQTRQLDSLYLLLKPLMTASEIKTYRSGNIDAKRHLFIEFWKKRDTDMSTGINEYYIEIMNRIDYANKEFTYLNKGATSDRGRVLIKYGYPSEVQRSAAGGYTKDHEVWLYEGMRGDIQFVFCDTKGRGYYELIHSNMEGEIYNAQWKDIITAGAKSY
jgi:GWxTD domain-containing protein